MNIYIIKKRFKTKQSQYQIHQLVAMVFSKQYKNYRYSYSCLYEFKDNIYEYVIRLRTTYCIPAKLAYQKHLYIETEYNLANVESYSQKLQVQKCLYRIKVHQIFNSTNPLINEIISKYKLKQQYLKQYHADANKTLFIVPNINVEFTNNRVIEVDNQDFIKLVGYPGFANEVELSNIQLVTIKTEYQKAKQIYEKCNLGVDFIVTIKKYVIDDMPCGFGQLTAMGLGYYNKL